MWTSPFEENKYIFDKITAFLDFEILQFLAKTLWKVCIINSSYGFLSNQSETLHKCFRHIEDVHLFFLKRKIIIFVKITAILDFEVLQFLNKTLWNVCIINSF